MSLMIFAIVLSTITYLLAATTGLLLAALAPTKVRVHDNARRP